MLRVCGITYAHSPNYGSCLQTYALQHVIESLVICGEECSYKVIPIQMLRDYPVSELYGRIGRIANVLLAWNRLQYRSFYKKYMNYAECTTIKELHNLNNQYDAFVCGSDVIWNDRFNRHVGAYYLDFAEKYRFSYAASFGKAEFSDDYFRFAGDKINRLDAISVRELSAVQIAKRCTEKDVRVVSDPVLLVDRKEWKKIASENVPPSPYIFVYVTHINNIINNFLNKLKETTNLRVEWAFAGPKQAIKHGMLTVHKPEEWLGLLSNAEFVVTNSFHATAFSVLFHKKFFTVVYGDKMKGINVRMNDFLNTIELDNRIFNDVPSSFDLSDFDYSCVDEKIRCMREESLSFLRQNLETAYQKKLELKCKVNREEGRSQLLYSL